MIALAATATKDGIVNVPGATGTGAFSVTTGNMGAGGVVSASADAGGGSVPVSLSICETNAADGSCKAAPPPGVTRVIAANEPPTFTVFVAARECSIRPANNRVFVRFDENAACAGQSAVVTRGSTRVAVRTQ